MEFDSELVILREDHEEDSWSGSAVDSFGVALQGSGFISALLDEFSDCYKPPAALSGKGYGEERRRL